MVAVGDGTRISSSGRGSIVADVARHALLQQQLGGLHARLRVEALDHAVAEQGIGQGHERHALVMRHVRRDDDARRRVARGERVGAAVGVVDRVEEAELAGEARGGEPPQVGRARGGVDEEGERGGVRRHDDFVAEAALQAEAGDAEGLVLIRAVPVDEVVGRLRDAPRHAARRTRSPSGA